MIFFSNWRHKPAIVPNVSHFPYPMCSVYGIFTNIDPINHPNVGKYTLHGSYGYVNTNVLLNVLLILVVPPGLLQLQYFDYRESTFLKKRKKNEPRIDPATPLTFWFEDPFNIARVIKVNFCLALAVRLCYGADLDGDRWRDDVC